MPRFTPFGSTLAAALMCFFTFSAAAFDLQEAVIAAKNYSAEYGAARYEYEAEQEKPAQARAALLPQVNATAVYRHEPASVSNNARSRGWNVQAEQVLYDRSRWLQYRQSRLAAQSALWKLQNAGSDLVVQTAKAYFDVLSAKEQLSAADDERTAFDRQLKQAQAAFQSGTATLLDIKEAQSGYDTALAKETAAFSRLLAAKNALSSLTGLDASQVAMPVLPSPLPDVLDGKPQEWWLAAAEEHNPELKQQQLAAENARLALSEAKARHLPRISASAGYQDYRNRRGDGSRNDAYRSRGAGFSVQLTMPLFSGGLTASQNREAAARLSQSEALLAAARRKVRQSVIQSFLETKSQWFQTRAQERLLETNRAKRQAAETGYSLGMSTTLQVVQARQAESEARQKLAEARFACLSAYAELIRHAGLLAEGEVSENFIRLKGIALERQPESRKPAAPN